jgi:hypothetical protein
MATRTCLDTNLCGTTCSRPDQGPTALPALNLNYYKCNVQPVMARTCAMVGCHGTVDPSRPFRLFARGRQRNAENVVVNGMCSQVGQTNIPIFLPNVSATASCYAAIPLTPTEWQINFDIARAFALGVPAAQSELLNQPLRTNGSFAHAGIKPWLATDAEFITVQSWLNGMTQASCNTGAN